MARSKSSGRWLQEHFSDPYVRRAQVEGRRSRAAYKLEELLERDLPLRPGVAHRRSGSGARRLEPDCRRDAEGQGAGFDADVRELRACFDKVVLRKPKASRGRSREIYALATGFKL